MIADQSETVCAVPKPDAGRVCKYESSTEIQPKTVNLDFILQYLVLSGFGVVAGESAANRINPIESAAAFVPNRALTAEITVISYKLNHDGGMQSGSEAIRFAAALISLELMAFTKRGTLKGALIEVNS
jgi:hypothetical protein